jgi:hypothetical protein
MSDIKSNLGDFVQGLADEVVYTVIGLNSIPIIAVPEDGTILVYDATLGAYVKVNNNQNIAQVFNDKLDNNLPDDGLVEDDAWIDDDGGILN